MITINWSATAAAQLNNPNNGYTQTGLIVIRNHTQNWVLASADGWALNSIHTYQDPSLQFRVTARLVAIVPIANNPQNDNRTVSIINFQP